MKHKVYSALSILLAGAMLFSGCAAAETTEETASAEPETTASASAEGEAKADQTASATPDGSAKAATAGTTDVVDVTEADYFSDRDLSGEVDTANAVTISLNGDSITASADGVSISGSTATITKEGTYILSGTLNDGSIIVDVDKEAKVQLVLDGVSITAKDFAPIYVVQADKVFITLMDGTTNTLTNGGTYTQIDDNNVDAVIFSKDDLTLNGTGTLNITASVGHGIVGKDDVAIASGTYQIDTPDTAIRANDSIAVADGTFRLTSDSDGLHAENNDDDTLGGIYIEGGTFEINVGDDGIHATTFLQIDGGTFDITAAEGLEATYITINDGTISISASDDGINAAKKSSLYSTPTVEINGGSTTIVMGAGDTDGVDANGNIIINGGTVDVTGNSTFDYDGTGEINGGTVIANGEQITTMPSQMMGGHGGMGGDMRGDMGGSTDGSVSSDMHGGMKGDMSGDIGGGKGGHHGFDQSAPADASGSTPGNSSGETTADSNTSAV